MRRVAFSGSGRLRCGMVVLLAAGLLAGGPARAADSVDEMGAEDLLSRAPAIEDTSGWYLRGDIGYVFNEMPEASQLDFSPVMAPSIDDAWLFGLGLGVKLNDLLRLDVTVDYRTEADLVAGGLSASYSATTLLANIYVDFGTWHEVTPYVGAGVGAGYVSISDIAFLGADIGDSDGWGLAWALMAGAAVAVGPNWQIDIGYRYLTLTDVGANKVDFEQSAHEVRVGARYLFD